MKRMTHFFVGLFLLLFSVIANGQGKLGADYFEGTWAILLKGLPDGDAKMTFILARKGDSLTGVVQDSTGKEISKIDKVELKDTTATVYFTAQGYDVNLVMNKKDEEHITGNLMGMFEAEGERKKSKP